MEIKLHNHELPNKGEHKYFDYPELKQELIVANTDSGYKVFSSFCPHFGGKLEIKNGDLYCYFHDYIFDVESGSCKNKPLGSKCQKISFFEDEEGMIVEVL